ncbi:phosphatidate cytidylyltransferase [Roseimaritima sediminicola]|uniref:phosphatidate cytidylyltransferase n=1 Tax=Roseimaritima sediminicola TaxID=2662066 RepID=UPI001298491B|nr:phosphatidate cytidylyltransferase [Roseimaritima sediminicola]
MLKDRLLSSVVLLSVVGLLLWLDLRYPLWGVGGLWLLPLLLALTIGTAADICRLLQGANRLVDSRVTILAAVVVPVFACVPYLWEVQALDYPADCPVGRLGWVAVGAFAAIAIVLVAEMRRYGRGPAGAIDRVQAGVFVALYTGLPMAMLVAVRNLHGDGWGLAALITLIAATKSCDAGAYGSGKLLGRHKLIPRLSPGKTWEGAIGGVLLSVVVAYGCVHFLFPAMGAKLFASPPWWGPGVLGAVCALSGMAGDLAESLIKRDTGAKDSGTTLPGLGGVWDVTDSLIAASVPGFLCFAAGLAGT